MISARARRRLERKPVRARAARPVLEALVALVVFAGGFELLPAFHQVAHGSLGAHVHEGERAASGPRATTPAAPNEADALSCDRARPTHGHDSVAHRGVLFVSAPAPTPLVPMAGLRGRVDAIRVRTAFTRRAAVTYVARGPPRAGATNPRMRA